ncbi:hypothetical protein [Ruminococcus sp.]|uniref:hypothetical protein n=1 Tax=Ruminococcus sp. TaxID=41978 RepID=UPI0025D4C08C|nr:hypothetical protein [Ruminococcus sp.]MBQ8967440.1 hypothetical protein [Ruminococcus sp.]
MKTDVITITSDLAGKEDAMQAAERFCEYNGIEGRGAKHIRLLTEETVSMVHGIMDNFRGELWLESDRIDKGTMCRICLSAMKSADGLQEEKLLSVATSGKNENAKGIMGKIRELFRMSIQHNADGVYTFTDPAADSWYYMGVHGSEMASGAAIGAGLWSLMAYRSNLSESVSKASEEWDELEKSIIANIADDVKVWLKSDSTQIIIEKLITA